MSLGAVRDRAVEWLVFQGKHDRTRGVASPGRSAIRFHGTETMRTILMITPRPVRALLGAALVLLPAIACDQGTTGPDDSALTATEANDWASALDGYAAVVMASQTAEAERTGSSSDARTIEITFKERQACPAGGEMRLEGRIVREHVRETRTTTARGEATQIMAACVRAGERGSTLTVDGDMTLTADHRWVDGRLSGPQTQSLNGTLKWTHSSGKTRSCEYHTTAAYDPEKRIRTLSGTVCGREVERTVSWSAT